VLFDTAAIVGYHDQADSIDAELVDEGVEVARQQVLWWAEKPQVQVVETIARSPVGAIFEGGPARPGPHA
jgi:hypothetical protein